jgi:hypothetical protein
MTELAMAGEPEMITVALDEYNKDSEHWRAQVSSGHIVQVLEPSGSTTVLMSGQDFESFRATSEILSNP